MQHAGEFGMSVRKRHWNKGIGQALLAAFLTWCRNSGAIRKVNLRVWVDNLSLIHISAGLGLTEHILLHRLLVALSPSRAGWETVPAHSFCTQSPREWL